MFKTSKSSEPGRGPFRRLSDSETLLFVAQTLQPLTSEREAPGVPAKLQSLKDILAQQEIDLLNWPDSPSKDRFYALHLKARRLVAELSEDICRAASDATAANGADQASGK